MKKLLSILALALCFVACQNEPNVNGSNSDLVDVVLNIAAPELGITRADDDGDSKNAKDSAYGAIDYADAAFWAQNDLRYILEVYAEGDNDGSAGPIAKERLVNCLDAYAPTEFKLRLVPNRTYKFVVFADFVAQGSHQLSNPLEIADVYYNTAKLTAITSLTDGGEWNAMNEARDAYFISQNVNVTTGLTQRLILTRPFAKVRVVTTDILDLEKYATPSKVVVTYYNHPIYKSFNAVNGAISTEMTGDELTYVVEYNGQYNAGFDGVNYPSHMTLYADYIHAVAGQQSNINFRMDVYDQNGRLLKSNDFSTEIPVQRNHLTTLMGNVLTTEATVQILISDEFAGYYKYEVPEGIFDNDTIVVTGFENGGTYANGAYSYNVSNTTTGDSFTLNINDSALTNGALAEGEYNYGTDFTATDVMVSVTRASVAATAEGGKMIVDIDENGKYAIAVDLVAKTAAGDAFYPSFGFYGDFVIKAAETLAAPANFVGTVDGENVTFTWAAVDNATSYEVVFNGITASISEGTTATFTVKAGDEDQTLTASIVAKAEGYLDSEAATCEVVIPAKVIIPTYNIYFNNLAEWAEVYAHIWANEGENIGLEDVDWPGRKLTETETIEGVTYYVFHLPEEATGKTVNVVFNDGNGSQTKDLAGVATGDLFFDNYVEPVAPSDVVLYMKPNDNWKVDGARFAAYFFNNGETWYDMTLVEGETDIYAVTVPAGFVDVIFCRMNPGAAANNWNNKWNQTADLKIPTDGTNLYTIKEGTWDNGGGTWSTYTAAAPIVPVAIATPKVTTTVDVNVVTLTWDAVEGASHYTVQVDDDVEEEVNATSYTFEGDYEVEYTFTVKAIAADTEKNLDSEAAVVTATTEAKPADVPAAGSKLTVAEFLALANTEIEYELTGKITRVVNTVYGNFDLTDETGTIYIYGLVTPEGTEKTQWAAAGLREGDTITIKGKYSLYNDDPQISKAVYVSHVAAPFVSADAITVNSTDTTAAIEVLSNINWMVSCDAEWVKSYTQSGSNNGTINITLDANTSTENRTATFTLTGEGIEEYVVTLTQYGAGASDTKGTYTSEAFFKSNSASGNNKAAFEKVNIGETSYDCLKLGTSSVVGKYTSNAVNESGDLTLSFYAVGWNGKSSKLNVYLDGNKIGDTISLTSNTGAANNTPYTITPSDTTDYYSLTLTGVTESSTITFETVSGAPRAIIFGVQLY